MIANPGLKPKKSRSQIKRLGKWFLVLVEVCALVMATIGLIWFRHALYFRYVLYPRQAEALERIQKERQPVRESAGWQEYRGVLHSHSLLSHDSEVPFEAILRALQAGHRDFICLSDHCIEGRADFNRQWRGLHDGKLFIPGFEMKDGLMPFGAVAGTVLSNQTDSALLARQVVEHGGVLFYAHPEEPRVWERPELTGMEVFNIHAQFKMLGGLGSLVPDFLLNDRQFHDEIFARMIARPSANLQRWDELNRNRHLTGIAGNDCHQNVGLRLRCVGPTALRLDDTSPGSGRDIHLNALTRRLAGLVLGPLTPGRELIHLQADPYERMVQAVSTHVLAHELTELAILDALKAGRAFVGFDVLCDTTGFLWEAHDTARRVVMGESMNWSPAVRLRAAAPHPGQWTIFKDGAPAWQAHGSSIQWTPPDRGVYRVEVELKVGDEWKPWIYSNPIWLR